jgi:rRNA maturation endonuclease Nob1
MSGEIYQCGSCERIFNKLFNEECPYCGSGNWVEGYIDD